jgi:hypothetical protein
MTQRRHLHSRRPAGIDILAACNDPNLFGRQCRHRDSWRAWFAFLASLFALPLTDEQLELFQKHTGRTAPPPTPLHEAWLCVGRRGGKSFILALIAVYLACCKSWLGYLGPGEVATVMVIAADRRQARVIMR